MRISILIINMFLLVVTSSCEKRNSVIQADWIPTKFQKLVNDTSRQEPDTRARFYSVNDSNIFLYGRYGAPSQPFIFKILDYCDQVVDILPQINHFTIDISFYSGTEGYLLRSDGKLLLTEDGGNTWKDPNISVPNPIKWIHFLGPDSGVAIYPGSEFNNNILWTIDGGKSWQDNPCEFFRGSNYLKDFYIIPNNPRVCFLSVSEKMILFSRDGGFNWKLHSTHNLNEISIYFMSENEGYLTTSTGIFRIDQIGEQFNLVLPFDGMITKVVTKSEAEIFYYSNFTVYHTNNNFQSTRKMILEDPFPNEPWDRFIIDFLISDKMSLLVDSKGTLYKLAQY